MNLSDRRAKKTEHAMYTALSELLKEKPLHKITIQELVSKADLHRSTFYTHYTDIYDLYKSIEDEFIGMLDTYITAQKSHDYLASISGIIEYMYTNKWCAPIVFGPYAEPSFLARISAVLTKNFIRICSFEENSTKIPEEWNIIASYEMGGVLSMIKYWFNSDCAFSKDALIKMIYRIDNSLDKVYPEPSQKNKN